MYKETILEESNIDDSDLKQGYLTHLLLDKYFLEDFVLDNIYNTVNEDENIFQKDKIYLDYTIISPYLLHYFDISLEELKDILPKDDPNIKIDKYNETLKDILTIKETEPKYLDPTSFISFIEDTSEKIAKKHLRPSSR